MTKPCDHDKVFENAICLSFPPCQAWICRKCGQEGVDRLELQSNGDYDKVKEEFWRREVMGEQ